MGLEVFEEFFQVVLTQCMKAGLVDGETIHIDSSLIQGDVSVDSLQPAFAVLARQTFQRLEDNCSQPNEKTPDSLSTLQYEHLIFKLQGYFTGIDLSASVQ